MSQKENEEKKRGAGFFYCLFCLWLCVSLFCLLLLRNARDLNCRNLQKKAGKGRNRLFLKQRFRRHSQIPEIKKTVVVLSIHHTGSQSTHQNQHSKTSACFNNKPKLYIKKT
ncbi:uncharacterized protein A4U43_C02F22280 [Asparagus officinalis]|uniref:Uncharacterized protein n=1 Tax=Asparagus officinalis TaxID=4686 RepID=A0A5P1FK72_ASPOF|nr:uncharacterized protein A4U43_C02F22280 [Asparagus officinalis]